MNGSEQYDYISEGRAAHLQCANNIIALKSITNIILAEKSITNIILADMAQLVEQRIRNAQVVGSSPTISSKKFRSRKWAEFFTYSLLTFHSSLSMILHSEKFHIHGRKAVGYKSYKVR